MVVDIRAGKSAPRPSVRTRKTVHIEQWVELSAAVLEQPRVSRLERDLATNVLVLAGGTIKGAARIHQLKRTSARFRAVVKAFDVSFPDGGFSIEGTRPPPAPGPRPPRPTNIVRGTPRKSDEP